jgi:thiol:disulfide interchange protein DsbD
MAQVLVKTLAAVVFLSGAILFYQGLTSHYFPAAAPTQAVAERPLPWLGDLAQAKEKARVENKRLMIDAWAEWCAACRELDERTFSRDDVRENLSNYILVKIDLTRKNAGSESLRRELAIIGMPTIIFLDASGKEAGRFSGFLGGNELISRLRGLENK